MKHITRSFAFSVGLCIVALGQTSQPPATATELKYFRFLLMTLAEPHFNPTTIQMKERAIVHQFGLNATEATLIMSAAQQYRLILQQAQDDESQIIAGKSSLGTVDQANLASLDLKREQAVQATANQILNGVTPGTANRLRAAGNVLPTLTGK